ncbi:hypothetical protein MQX03_11520 [Chryseobacterium aahli]|uniref:hypothetical protein n=1 Tax=Chryseobacterium aahli TaxID=1278643 RepID=UPI001F624441|nr:hypothetical protein [Chryseobacterium aahli]MCI3937834.1 hypothetical protein [Chryseobacterium aahli]
MKFFKLKILLAIVSAVFLNFDKTDKIQTPVIVEIYKLKKNKYLNNKKISDFEYHLIFGQTKSSEINPEFISKLKNAGYKKINLENDRILEISKFLTTKKESVNNYETACKKVFRDLIIFKQQNKILKVIKVCTSCYSNQVITNEAESELLLNFEDYDYLSEEL